MREILFRGKRTDNGEWVQSGNVIAFSNEGEGKLNFIPKQDTRCVCVHDDDDNIISFKEGMFYKVIPETVGQYTGLTDKNGKKIFEGDILEYVDSDNEVGYLTVVFEECAFLIEEDGITNPDLLTSYVALGLKVVGNVYDNLELLKGGVEE